MNIHRDQQFRVYFKSLEHGKSRTRPLRAQVNSFRLDFRFPKVFQ